MKKFIITALFFLAAQYQYIFSHLEFSPVALAALIGLSVYHLFEDRKDIRIKGVPAAVRVNGAHLKVFIFLYVAGMIAGVYLLKDHKDQTLFILSRTFTGAIILFLYQSYKEKKELERQKEIIDYPSRITCFTIPVIFLYLNNFLLGAQLHDNIAFLFANILSCVVLWHTLIQKEKTVRQLESGETDMDEFKHAMFHQWIKHFNFFLMLWYIQVLQQDRIISRWDEFFMLAAFIILYFSFTLRTVYRFNLKDFATIIIFAVLAASLDPLLGKMLPAGMPGFIQPLMIFILYDLGDLLFHHRQFASREHGFVLYKLAFYAAAGLFMVGLYDIKMNTLIEPSDYLDAAVIKTDRVTAGIEVPDTENAFTQKKL